MIEVTWCQYCDDGKKDSRQWLMCFFPKKCCWSTICKMKQQHRTQQAGLLPNIKTNTRSQQVGEWVVAQAGVCLRIFPGSSMAQEKVKSPEPALGDVFFNDSWVVL